jgi:undecaprenyl-diphosphatase
VSARSPARFAAIAAFGIVLPLALLPALAAARAPWDLSVSPPAGSLVLFSAIGGGPGLVVLTSVAIAWLVRQGRERDGAFVGLSVVLAHVLGRLSKDAFDAARPWMIVGDPISITQIPEGVVIAVAATVLIVGLLTAWRQPALVTGVILAVMLAIEAVLDMFVPLIRGLDSFPSGHATASMALAASLGVIAWEKGRRGFIIVAGAFFVLVVGISRVYLGVHYPADVLGGWCVATAATCATWLTVRAILDGAPVVGGPGRRWRRSRSVVGEPALPDPVAEAPWRSTNDHGDHEDHDGR